MSHDSNSQATEKQTFQKEKMILRKSNSRQKAQD